MSSIPALRPRRWFASTALLALPWLALPLLPACTSVPEDHGLSDVRSLVAERMPQRVVWDRGGPQDEQVARHVAELLHGELTADDAVQVALVRNAHLQATFEDLGIAQADLVQAGLFANPILDFELRFPADPHRPFELHVIEDVMSIFTQPLRERLAEAEVEAAKVRVADAVLNLAAEVRAAHVEAQAAEQLVELRQTVAVSTAAAADAAQRLREAGNIPDLELANELAVDGEARLALMQAEADRTVKREHLSALMGLWGADIAWRLPARLPDLPPQDVSPEGLEALATARRLDLAAAAHDIETAAAALDLTDTTALIPSLDIGLHQEREPEGSSTVGPSVGLPLPIFDQGQGRRAHDEALLRRSQQAYRALAVQIRSDVRAQHARLLAARARAAWLHDIVLPLRDRIVQQTQLHYNAMQLGVFELLMARRAEVDAASDGVEALRDYWLAHTALQRAVGGSLDGQPLAAVEAPASGAPGDMHPPAEPPDGDASAPPTAPPTAPMHGHTHGDHP